jgi:hypothetical protein
MPLIFYIPDAHDTVFEAQQTCDLHSLSLHMIFCFCLYFLEADKKILQDILVHLFNSLTRTYRLLYQQVSKVHGTAYFLFNIIVVNSYFL